MPPDGTHKCFYFETEIHSNTRPVDGPSVLQRNFQIHTLTHIKTFFVSRTVAEVTVHIPSRHTQPGNSFPAHLLCKGFRNTRMTESPRRNILEM